MSLKRYGPEQIIAVLREGRAAPNLGFFNPAVAVKLETQSFLPVGYLP